MQNKLMIFNHEMFGEVRIVDQGGDAWFPAKDVCEALGFTKYRDAIARYLDESERVSIPLDTPGGVQEMTCISESGFYAIAFASTKPQAKKFRLWVTNEVLPTIRKTGSYSISEPSTSMVPVAREYRVAIQIAELSGLKENQAILAADKATRKFTGHSPLNLMGITHLICQVQEDHLTAGDIGKIFSVSAQKANKMLEAAGIIESYRDHKSKQKWKATESGKSYTILKDTGKKHGGGAPVQQLFFFRSVVDLLKSTNGSEMESAT